MGKDVQNSAVLKTLQKVALFIYLLGFFFYFFLGLSKLLCLLEIKTKCLTSPDKTLHNIF